MSPDRTAVRAAYGQAVQSGPHKNEEAPAEYLTVWAKDARGREIRGSGDGARIVYEDGGKGVVQAISAGRPSILYVEGCA